MPSLSHLMTEALANLAKAGVLTRTQDNWFISGGPEAAMKYDRLHYLEKEGYWAANMRTVEGLVLRRYADWVMETPIRLTGVVATDRGIKQGQKIIKKEKYDG